MFLDVHSRFPTHYQIVSGSDHIHFINADVCLWQWICIHHCLSFKSLNHSMHLKYTLTHACARGTLALGENVTWELGVYLRFPLGSSQYTTCSQEFTRVWAEYWSMGCEPWEECFSSFWVHGDKPLKAGTFGPLEYCLCYRLCQGTISTLPLCFLLSFSSICSLSSRQGRKVHET